MSISKSTLKELWRISFPLMISYLSLSTMQFVDRLYLAWYSLDALNASTSSGTLSWAFYMSWITIAGSAQVLVARYNGAKEYQRLGPAVWQMIYLASFSILFFVPMAFYGRYYLHPLEAVYFKWTMLFSPSFVVIAAISAFYTGRGLTKVITYLSLLSNGINIILDPILIFGMGVISPSYGIAGAAIATGIGEVAQMAILFYLFLSVKNRTNFNTGDARFNWKELFLGLRLGGPTGLFSGIEYLGLAGFYLMMGKISDNHILIASISQSILLLFLFFGYGLEKGVMTIAGNLIGAGQAHKIKSLFFSGVKLNLWFALFSCVFLIIYPTPIIHLFHLAGHEEIITEVKYCMAFTAIFLMLENLRWLISGILTAAGDTVYLMITGTLSVWLFMVMPIYYFVYLPKASIMLAFTIWIVYLTVQTSFWLTRYFRGKWQGKFLIPKYEETT